MRKTRYSEDQIIRVLQEVESSGSTVKDVCREHVRGVHQGRNMNGWTFRQTFTDGLPKP
jgi:transposase-like protein